MGKLMKKSCKPCQKHLMTLIPISSTANRSQQMSHIFCRQKSSCFPTFPRFNKNPRITKFGFTLSEDQEFLNQQIVAKSDQSIEFNSTSSSEFEQIWIPKPKQLYCQICKTKYDDYKKHYSSEKHIENKNLSLFNREIELLCQIYGNQKSQNELETDISINVFTKDEKKAS